MKKIFSFLLIFILIFNMTSFVYADEEEQEEVPQEPQAVEQPQEEAKVPEEPEVIEFVERAKVVQILDRDENDGENIQKVKVRITTGNYADKEFDLKYNLAYDANGKVKADSLQVGSKVLVQINYDTSGNMQASIISYDRIGTIIVLVILFCICLCLINGKYGIKLIISLLITAIAVWFILIKLIVVGWNSVIVAIITSVIIIQLITILFGGVHRKAFSSAIGAVIGIIVAGIFTAIFTNVAHLTGARGEVIELSNSLVHLNFNLKDIIISASMLTSTGICLDISMHITNLLYNEKSKTEDLSIIDAFKQGLSKGKDVIGSKSIVLFLVYCASSLSLLVLCLSCDMHIIEILDKDIVTEQVIVSICGSLGVLCSIPGSSLAFAWLNHNKLIYNTKAKNKVEGKRSLKIK